MNEFLEANINWTRSRDNNSVIDVSYKACQEKNVIIFWFFYFSKYHVNSQNNSPLKSIYDMFHTITLRGGFNVNTVTHHCNHAVSIVALIVIYQLIVIYWVYYLYEPAGCRDHNLCMWISWEVITKLNNVSHNLTHRVWLQTLLCRGQ